MCVHKYTFIHINTNEYLNNSDFPRLAYIRIPPLTRREYPQCDILKEIMCTYIGIHIHLYEKIFIYNCILICMYTCIELSIRGKKYICMHTCYVIHMYVINIHTCI